MSNWKVKRTYMEACNCEALCTCIFFSPPTEGHCIVMLGWKIDEGSFDGADLGGLNAAILATAPGNMKDGGWKVALYTDSRANEDQNNALMGIFSGEAGKAAAKSGNKALSTAFSALRMIVTVGWAIYPLGYVFGYLTGGVDADSLNVVYNLADFINKIAFGLVIWAAATSSSGRRAK